MDKESDSKLVYERTSIITQSEDRKGVRFSIFLFYVSTMCYEAKTVNHDHLPLKRSIFHGHLIISSAIWPDSKTVSDVCGHSDDKHLSRYIRRPEKYWLRLPR